MLKSYLNTNKPYFYMTYLSSGSLTDGDTWGKVDSSASGATEQPETQYSGITWKQSNLAHYVVTVMSLHTEGHTCQASWLLFSQALQWRFVNLYKHTEPNTESYR